MRLAKHNTLATEVRVAGAALYLRFAAPRAAKSALPTAAEKPFLQERPGHGINRKLMFPVAPLPHFSPASRRRRREIQGIR